MKATMQTKSGRVDGDEYGVDFAIRGLTKRQARIVQDHIEHFIIDRFSADGVATDTAWHRSHH